MKINVPDIATTLVSSGIPTEKQAAYLQAAVARVVGYLLPIPAEAVADTQAHFKGLLEGRAAAAVDAINERMPLDFNSTLAMIRQIWEVRYGMVHPSSPTESWAVIDACVQKARISAQVDFNDPLLQRLGSVLSAGVEQ